MTEPGLPTVDGLAGAESASLPLRVRVRNFFRGMQDYICRELEALDGTACFHGDEWERPGGGGGLTRVVQDGTLFEKGGVNFSEVSGLLPERIAQAMGVEPREFFATGISLVLHPRSPMIPTVHANYRYFELERGDSWFGGGSDLTPYYPCEEDAVHFHRTLKAACDVHDLSYYPRFKQWCDEYFFLRHRKEARGFGGIFFDYLRGKPEHTFGFVRSAAEAFLPSYVPVVARRRSEQWGEQERRWQLIRRGRYVEFNLVYDRGTMFGLETEGRTESILMSLPPVACWEYDHKPVEGSREAALLAMLAHPRTWVTS
jgi:coproporphyrinogen III oxidase